MTRPALSLLFALFLALVPGCDGPGGDDATWTGLPSFFSQTRPATTVGLAATDSVVTTARQLPLEIRSPGNAVFASVTRDGQWWVTTDWDTGDIVLAEIHGDGEHRVTRNQGSYDPGWGMRPIASPEGARVAFTWIGPDWDVGLRVMDVHGADREPVSVPGLEPGWSYVYDWSPDGTDLAVVRPREDGIHELVVAPLEGSEPRTLRSLGWSFVRGAAFSPDGRWVAFDFAPRDDSRTRDIHVVATDGSEGRAVVEGPSDDWLLGWSPEGFLLFVSDRAGTPGAWRLPMEAGRPAGAPEPVKPDLWRVAPMGFDHEGRFFYVHRTGDQGVHVASFDPESGRIAGAPTPVDPQSGGMDPAWSPDGRHLAYLVERAPFGGGVLSERVLRVRALESGEVRDFDLPVRSHGERGPRWTPDGRAILVRAAYDRGGASVLRVDLQTGEVERVLHTEHDPYNVAVLPDGRGIVYTQPIESGDGKTASSEEETPGEADAGWRILVRDLADGSEAELYRPGVPAAEAVVDIRWLTLSPQGDRLAFLQRTEPRGTTEDVSPYWNLLVMSVEGGDPETVLEGLDSDWTSSLTWSADGRSLLFTQEVPRSEPAAEGRDAAVALWSVRPDGGEPEELGRFPHRLLELDAHPDGRRIAFRTGVAEAGLWVMEDIAPIARRVGAPEGR